MSQVHRFASRQIRNQRGEMVGGVAGLLLIVIGMVLAVLVVTNVGMATYYKQKLGFIADQVATQAANTIASPMFTDNATVISQTQSNATKLLNDVGLPAATSVNVVINPPTNPTSVTVTINVAGLKMFGNGNVLPAVIAMSDTSEALIDNTRPRYAATILEEESQVGGGVGVGVLVPAYGGFSCANGAFSNYTATYFHGKINYQLANFFGVGSILNDDGTYFFNTNYAAPTSVQNYPATQTALNQLFAIEGNY
jgi:hypothetical protein